jgi:opacity protein-like surface antigen
VTEKRFANMLALPKVRIMRSRTLQRVVVGAAAAFIASVSTLHAGQDMKNDKSMQGMTPPCCTEKDWTLEVGSGGLWSNVRSGEPNAAYTIVPISLTASLRLDDDTLGDVAWGIFRGHTEFFFRGDYDQIVHGPETHYEGLVVGPRYNFVQPGWKLIPYVEGGVGFVFADSRPDLGGLGQDFNFTFTVGAGAKYEICDDFFVRLGVEYQHVSNAGLSEPAAPNHPIDGLGPKLSFGYTF